MGRRTSIQAETAKVSQVDLPSSGGELHGSLAAYCLSWGGSAEARREKQIWIFDTFWDTPKMTQSQGLSTTTPLLDQKKARKRRSKTCQIYPRAQVHRCASSGKDAGNEGRIHTHAPVPRMRQKWVPWVTNPTPFNKGLLTAWTEKSVKIREIFFCTQKWFCLRSQHCIFSQFFGHFSQCCQRFFRTFFSIFRSFFRTIFRNVFLTEFLHVTVTHFSNTFVQSCVLPTGFS